MATPKTGKPQKIGPIEGKAIEILIDETGDGVQIEAHGYNGMGCQEATAGIERALGTVTSRTEKTPEQRVHQKIGKK
jgi:hypothetical protein